MFLYGRWLNWVMASLDPKKLLKSVKELITENTKMKKEIDSLKREMAKLRQRDTLLARSILKLYKGKVPVKKVKKKR